jgi:hypothetical protein
VTWLNMAEMDLFREGVRRSAAKFTPRYRSKSSKVAGLLSSGRLTFGHQADVRRPTLNDDVRNRT